MLNTELLARHFLPPASGLLTLATIEIPPLIIKVITNQEIVDIEVVDTAGEVTRFIYDRKNRVKREVK